MTKKRENDGFICENCGREVLPATNGSYRNHCPFCLCSKHVDGDTPGDRASECGGVMRPVGAEYSGRKGWMLVQKCDKCGHIMRNKIAENTVQPDDMELIRKLTARES